MRKLGRAPLPSLLALALAISGAAPARAGHDEPVTNAQLPLAPILKYSDATTAASNTVKASTNASGQYEIDLYPDYLSQESTNAMTGPNAITVGGTCHAGDVVGINLTYNSTAYQPRYTVQSSDCSASSPLASIATGLASAIGTALSVPTTTIGAVAYFNLYYPGATTTSGYATSLSGGATETLTLGNSGAIFTWLEVMPIFAQGRYIAGRDAVAGDLIGDYLVVAGDSTTPSLIHQAFSIITSIINPSPSSYDTAVALSTATDDLYGSGAGWGVGTVPGAAPTTYGAGTFAAANGLYGPVKTGAQPGITSLGALAAQLTWTTGLGAINQLAGPTDEPFALSASAPAAAATSTAGNAFDLTAANATAGSSTAGAAAGGAVNITSGNAARLTSGNANGGNIVFDTGSGIGTGSAGQVIFQTGGTTNLTLSGGASPAAVFAGSETATALGVNESAPSTGNVNISGQYQVGGSQISTSNLSDTTACGSYLPTDQSGAGLTLTTSVQYCKYGNLVYLYGLVIYPSTSSSAQATISLPVAVPNHLYAQLPAIVLGSGTTFGGVAITLLPIRNTSTATFQTAANATVTNANLSTLDVYFMLIYPVS